MRVIKTVIKIRTVPKELFSLNRYYIEGNFGLVTGYARPIILARATAKHCRRARTIPLYVLSQNVFRFFRFDLTSFTEMSTYKNPDFYTNKMIVLQESLRLDKVFIDFKLTLPVNGN